MTTPKGSTAAPPQQKARMSVVDHEITIVEASRALDRIRRTRDAAGKAKADAIARANARYDAKMQTIRAEYDAAKKALTAAIDRVAPGLPEMTPPTGEQDLILPGMDEGEDR